MPTPNPDSDNSIYLDVLKVLRELGEDIRTNKEEQIQALKLIRDTTFRALNLLNHEVVGLLDQKKKDDKDREDRQKQVDKKLDQIHASQLRQRTWQVWRLVIEGVVAGLVVVVLIVWAVLVIRG